MTSDGSDRARRVALRLLGWYPRPWRTRYGAEMAALVDEMPVRWRQVADLAIGAAREWASPRALGWPARSAAGKVQAARGFLFLAAAIGMAAIANVLAGRLVAIGWSAPAWLSGLTDAAYLAMTLRFLLLALALLGKPRWIARHRWLGAITGLEISMWFAASCGYLLIALTEPVPTYVKTPFLYKFSRYFGPMLPLLMLFQQSTHSRRLRRVLHSHVKRGGTSTLYTRQ